MKKIQFIQFCIFLIRLYIKTWFYAPITSLAPFQDLQFLKSLVDYENIHKNISQSTLKKLCGHLWYLAPKTAALVFFDTNLTIETKIKMVDSIKQNDLTSEINKRIIVSPDEVTQLMKKEIYDFIYVESTSFFFTI